MVAGMTPEVDVRCGILAAEVVAPTRLVVTVVVLEPETITIGPTTVVGCTTKGGT